MQQARCFACVLYSETLSRWNLKCQAMPHRGVNCRHRDKGFASRTFWKLYESTFWRQARWRQTVSQLAFTWPPRVSAFKLLIWFVLVGSFIYMSLSCFASAYLLSIGLGDLWARGEMRIAVALRLCLLSAHAFRSCIQHGLIMLWVRGGVRVRPWHLHV